MSTPQKYQINDIRSKFQTVAVSNFYQAFFETNAYLLREAAKVGIDNRFVQKILDCMFQMQFFLDPHLRILKFLEIVKVLLREFHTIESMMM